MLHYNFNNVQHIQLYFMFSLAALASLMERRWPQHSPRSAGMIMLVDNLIQVAFLVVPMDKVGKAWMNWSVVVVVVAAAGMLVPMKERYDRWSIDQV